MVQPTLLNIGASAAQNYQRGQQTRLANLQEQRAQAQAPLRNRLLELQGDRTQQDIGIARSQEARAQQQASRKAIGEIAPMLVSEIESLLKMPSVDQRVARVQQIMPMLESVGLGKLQISGPEDLSDGSLLTLQRGLMSGLKSAPSAQSLVSKIGVNPSTGKNEFFTLSGPNQVNWTGVEPPTDVENLSSHLQKRLSTSNDEVGNSQKKIFEYDSLASQLEATNFRGGWLGGTVGELFKDALGTQDVETELRKRFQSARNTLAMSSLPPGAASDRDVRFALEGLPSNNTDNKSMARFVRGLARMEELNQKFHRFKSSFISRNKSEEGLVEAWDASDQFNEWKDTYWAGAPETEAPPATSPTATRRGTRGTRGGRMSQPSAETYTAPDGTTFTVE